MNREILFRGKRLDNGEWVESHSILRVCDGVYKLDTIDKWMMVDPSTVGQYTGKNDRNQHRAFVGDIVRCRNEQHTVYGIIRFGEITDTEGGSKHIGYYIEWQNDGANMWGDWWRRDLGYWLDDQHCEICGNLHDNPELIGGEDDG